MALQNNNFRRLLRTVEALSDLGPEMTAERDFAQTARLMISALRESAGAREAAGLPAGSGPYRVITDLAVLDYADATKRMRACSLHPGVGLEQVQAATGFRLEVADPLATTEPPTAEELRILREEVDPHRYILGRPC